MYFRDVCVDNGWMDGCKDGLNQRSPIPMPLGEVRSSEHFENVKINEKYIKRPTSSLKSQQMSLKCKFYN